MAKNQDKTKNDIYNYFKSNGYEPVLKSTNGKEVSVPEEAEVIEFQFNLDGESYGTAAVSLDNEGQLKVFYSDKIENSPTSSDHGETTWKELIPALRQMTFGKTKSFELDDMDNLEYDMAKREHSKKLEEGYYPMGKKASYSDNIPECKIVIKHNRNIEEGEQRYRNIHQIFIENALGERFLAPTVKPGLARVYARHIAEGGKVNDDKWNHITGLCEEYSKMAGFIRATRNGQFNEDTQRLVSAGTEHYISLRESLHKLAGKRGYNNYFESWAPPLMESEGDEDLSEMFMNSSLDPRIESVIPILNRLNKTISENQEIKQVIELEKWADDIAEGMFSHDVERAFPKGKASGVKSHPAVVKTNKPIGTRVADIGKGGKEHNVRTDREWDKQKGVAEGTRTGDPVYIEGCEWDDVVSWLVKNVGPLTKKSPNYAQGWEGRGWILYPTNRTDEEGLEVLELSANTKLANKQILAKKIQMACSGRQGVAEGRLTNFDNLSDAELIRLAHRGYINGNLEYNHDGHLVNRDEIIRLLKATDDAGEESDDDFMEQGMAEGSLEEDEYDKMLRDLLKARPDLTKKYAKDVQKSKDIESGKELNKLVKKNPGVLKTYSDAVKRDKKLGMAEGRPEDLPGIDYDRPGDIPHKKSGKEHNPYPFSKEEDDEYFNNMFRKQREEKLKKSEDLQHMQKLSDEDVKEDIGPQQAAVGQLGATAKVNAGGTILGNPERSQKGLRGKLVGTNESVDPVLSRIKRLSGL
jgi:hypothetical protein